MKKVISIEDLKGLFTKPYGIGAPTKEKWAEFYKQLGFKININQNLMMLNQRQEVIN